MATAATVHSHAPQGFIRKYVFSLDHKVIGIQYFFLALTAVFVGMFLSLLMRIHLVWPNAVLPLVGEIKPETYLSLLTMHGTIMVFFVLTTAPQGGFGNYFLPIQIGAPDMAFPVLNMLSFWTTFVAFVTIIAAFFVTGGAPLHGWTGYAPLSALPSAGPGEGLGADLWITSIAIFCIASLMGALNFITTTLDLRAKGMTMMRMPLTVWSWFITAILGLLAFGVLLSAGILLLMDRNLGTSFYVPLVVVNGQIMGHKGGSPLLWQHLFWFFGHPDERALAGDLAREGGHRRIEFGVRHHAVDQADLAGAVGVDQVAGQQHFHRRLAAHGAAEGHHWGRAEQPDVDARRGEAGGLAGDGEVAGGDQLAAGGGGGAMHPRDDGFRERDDALHQAAAQREHRLVRGAGGGGAHLPHVVARAEGGTGGGDDHDVSGRVGRDAGERGVQRRHETQGEGVAGGGTVQGQRGDAVLIFAEQERGVGHGGGSVPAGRGIEAGRWMVVKMVARGASNRRLFRA